MRRHRRRPGTKCSWIPTTLRPIFMNANSNRCMTDRKKIALLWLMAAFSVSVAAQPYDRVERRNFWNAGSNVTGLRMDSLTVSYAELYGRYEAGGFRDTHEAARAWSAGA